MKNSKILSLTITSLFSVSIVAASTVSAQSNGAGATNRNTPTTSNGSASVAQPQPQQATTAADATAQLNERVAKRKAELKTKLTASQQKRMQGRCKNAQKVLAVNIERAKVVQTNRDKIHANLLERLTNLETKLKASGVDTTELSAQITDLKTKIETFKADTDAYLLAANDTATLDCQADPVAFKASLEASRAALKKVHTDAVAIRNSLSQSIKPLLINLKTALSTGGEN